MNVNSSSQLVVHAPKPIRPVFNGVGRLHRRRSSAASGAATTAAAAQAQSGSSAAGSTLTSPVSPAFNPSSMPSPVPIDARDASEELWSIFKRTASASPSSASFPPPASQLQRTPSAFQERASPLHLTTPPPRNALFNPLKFQPALHVWSQHQQQDDSDAAAMPPPPQPPQHSWSVGPAHPQAALKDIQWTDDKQAITAEPADARDELNVSASPMQVDEASPAGAVPE